jgi:hypothetical protein
MLGGFLADVMRSRQELLMENALLRQQLVVASRKVKRPIFKTHERGFVVLLASLMPSPDESKRAFVTAPHGASSDRGQV